MAKNDDRLERIEGQLDDLSPRVQKIELAIEGINSSVRTMKWGAGIVVLALVGLACTLGQSWVRETARLVVREELQHRATVVQHGRFTPDNRIADSPPSFRWDLRVPIDPEKVTMLTAEPSQPLPGVATSAELADGGKSCIMTLHGIAAARLPDVIDAKVTIAMRE